MNQLIEGTSWHSYPKIYNIGHREVADILTGDYIIEEKVDGSQFSFGVFGGVLNVRSKGVQMVVDAPEKMFTLAVDAVKAVQDKLIDGWTYRGEYLKTPKHNSLAYNRIPANHIAIFDINTAEEVYLPPDEKAKEAERLGFEVVPWFGAKINGPDDIRAFLERESFLGGPHIEGVVIKAYSKFGEDKKALMAKYVSEEFKEVHKKEWKKANPGTGDFVELIAQNHRTKARWMKSVQRLRDDGKLTNSPKDIGTLIESVREDVFKEEAEEIKDQLFKYAWDKVISRKVTAGVAEWYKELLMKQQFGAE